MGVSEKQVIQKKKVAKIHFDSCSCFKVDKPFPTIPDS